MKPHLVTGLAPSVAPSLLAGLAVGEQDAVLVSVEAAVDAHLPGSNHAGAGPTVATSAPESAIRSRGYVWRAVPVRLPPVVFEPMATCDSCQ